MRSLWDNTDRDALGRVRHTEKALRVVNRTLFADFLWPRCFGVFNSVEVVVDAVPAVPEERFF